jgi:hypothetical protein
MKLSRRSSKPKANANRSRSASRIAPTRQRFDVDSFVGFACVVLLPIALWFS